MKLPEETHTRHPWRIHELTHDFELEDVWQLPNLTGQDDFGELAALFARIDPAQSPSFAVRSLFAARRELGELFAWDDAHAGSGSRVPSLHDRLPADLRDAPSGPEFEVLPASSLYLLEDEWAAEVANRTMHGVVHLGRVPDRRGGFHAIMAVYVKPNGWFGRAYMAAIRPFRRLVVYPLMLRQLARSWESRHDRTDRS